MRAIYFIAVVAFAGHACAQGTSTQEAYKDVIAKVGALLASTFYCKNVIETSEYYINREAAEQAFRATGDSKDSAVVTVDEVLKRWSHISAEKASEDQSTQCADELMTERNDLKVSVARFRQASGM